MKNAANIPNEGQTPEAENPRREFLRKGAKSAYIIPAVLIAMKATERPALAASGLGTIPL